MRHGAGWFGRQGGAMALAATMAAALAMPPGPAVAAGPAEGGCLPSSVAGAYGSESTASQAPVAARRPRPVRQAPKPAPDAADAGREGGVADATPAGTGPARPTPFAGTIAAAPADAGAEGTETAAAPARPRPVRRPAAAPPRPQPVPPLAAPPGPTAPMAGGTGAPPFSRIAVLGRGMPGGTQVTPEDPPLLAQASSACGKPAASAARASGSDLMLAALGASSSVAPAMSRFPASALVPLVAADPAPWSIAPFTQELPLSIAGIPVSPAALATSRERTPRQAPPVRAEERPLAAGPGDPFLPGPETRLLLAAAETTGDVAVPEPAALLLFGFGIAALAGAAGQRRRRRGVQPRLRSAR